MLRWSWEKGWENKCPLWLAWLPLGLMPACNRAICRSSKQGDGRKLCKQTSFGLALSQALGDADHSSASRCRRGPRKTGGCCYRAAWRTRSHQLLDSCKYWSTCKEWGSHLCTTANQQRVAHTCGARGWSWALLCVWPKGGRADVHLAISLLKRSQ